MAFFVFAGTRLPYSSPIGDMFLFLYSFVTGAFGMMTFGWGIVAALNRKNKDIGLCWFDHHLARRRHHFVLC